MSIYISDEMDDALCQLSNRTGIRYGAVFSSYVSVALENKNDADLVDEVIKYSIDLGLHLPDVIKNDENLRAIYIFCDDVYWPLWVEDPSEITTYIDTMFGDFFMKSEEAIFKDSIVKKFEEMQIKMYEQHMRIADCENSI